MSETAPPHGVDDRTATDEDRSPPSRSGGRRFAFGPRILPPLLTLAVAGFVWWSATAVLPAPGDVVRRFDPIDGIAALRRLVVDGSLLPHVVASLRRLLVGLAVATVAGVVIGAATGWWRGLERATGPLVQLLRMISPLAWTPIVIIVVGIGDRPVQVLVALAAVWPVVLNTAAGVRALDPGWLLVARGLGATRWELLRTVIAPGVTPSVFTGIRLALGVGWIVLVPAEMLGVDSGLGYFVLDSRDRLAYDELVATILVIGLIGALLDGLLRHVTSRLDGSRSPATDRSDHRVGSGGARGADAAERAPSVPAASGQPSAR